MSSLNFCTFFRKRRALKPKSADGMVQAISARRFAYGGKLVVVVCGVSLAAEIRPARKAQSQQKSPSRHLLVSLNSAAPSRSDKAG